VPVTESTRVVNTYRPTKEEIKDTKEYSKKVGDLAQNIKKESNVSQKVAMQQAEQILEANSRVQPEAKPYANTKQAQERDAYVFDEGMNARDYFRYPLQFLSGNTPTQEERIQDRIRITDPRTSGLDKFMRTVGQAVNLAPEALLNTGVGLAFAPSRFSKLGQVADAVSPIGNPLHPDFIKGINKAGKYLTTQTPLKNAYKLNPQALKENPEMFLYRTQPKDFVAGYTEQQSLEDLITDKILKGEKVPFYLQGQLNKIKYEPESFRKALDEYHGQWFDKNPSRMDFYMKGRLDGDEGNILRLKVPKEEGVAYNLKNFPEAQKASLNYDTEFIVPKDKLNQAEAFSTNDWQQLMQEDKAFNTPNWLRGYKPIETPTSPFNTRAQNDILVEQARRSGEAPLPDYMEPYISRRYTPATKEQDVFESFLSPEKQAELRKLRTQTFTPKNQYQQGGIVLDLSDDEIKNTYKIKYPKIL
jgi:hypothetical protein